ncbi:MAG TPA: gluconate 2-dehydrogenase subunit 3 family protein [Cytophagales bacterium]|nr:gluconate 2-dehydrogenase subunit 3 family protein [Cytophagales bacterium]
MKRRDAILRVTGLLGASFSAPLLMGLSNYEKLELETLEKKEYLISESHKQVIEVIAELIIPETKTPGAKAAGVPEFIVMMIEECYKKEDKAKFYSGLNDFDLAAQNIYRKPFLNLLPAEQTDFLLKEEVKAKAVENTATAGNPFIIMIKELTLFGYFTSEIGCTQALEYLPVPGAYKSCISLEPDQKTWAI